jgi:alpha-aminoadipate carrier protein LysW
MSISDKYNLFGKRKLLWRILSMKILSVCPECDAQIELEDPVVREVVECAECGIELEIESIDGEKVKLVVAELQGEDWGE